jgi:hypothetical protein
MQRIKPSVAFLDDFSWKPAGNQGGCGAFRVKLAQVIFLQGKKFLHPGPGKTPDFLGSNFETPYWWQLKQIFWKW